MDEGGFFCLPWLRVGLGLAKAGFRMGLQWVYDWFRVGLGWM